MAQAAGSKHPPSGTDFGNRNGHSVAVCAALILAFLAATAAPAQEVDADFNAYCRANFPNSAYQRFAQSWGTEHACVQGGTRQGIDFAEACRLTNGNRGYREMGNRVLCSDDPATATAVPEPLGEPDYALYCLTTFPNSVYEFMAESPGTPHKCRQPGVSGGFTLQPVDAAAACQMSFGTTNHQMKDQRVLCMAEEPGTRSAALAPGGGGGFPSASGGGGSGGGGGPVPFPMPGLPGASGSPPGFPMPGLPSADLAGDPAQMACFALGGQWHDGTLPLVEAQLEAMQQQIDVMVPSCEHAPDPVFCANQMRVVSLMQAYFQTVMIWQCHVVYLQDPSGKSEEDLETAATEGCQISGTLEGLVEDIGAIVMTMEEQAQIVENPPHLLVTENTGVDPCAPCERAEPGVEVADLTARVRELAAEDDMLFADLDLPEVQACIDEGLLEQNTGTRRAALSPLDRLLQAVVGAAHAQTVDPVVSDEKGPFPNRTFGTFRTAELYFREVSRIRSLQDEMSQNGGRDSLLAEHTWAKFERDVDVTIRAMKIEDSTQASLILNDGLRTINATRDAMRDRLEELESLQERVNRELAGEEYVAFLDALDGLVKKNRELEGPSANNAHDPTYAQIALLIRTLRVMAAEGAKRFGTAPVGAVLAIASTYANACSFLDWSADVRQFERFKKPYMELLDLTASLTILIEQYKARIAAQNELVTLVNEEWDKEQRRRRECRRR